MIKAIIFAIICLYLVANCPWTIIPIIFVIGMILIFRGDSSFEIFCKTLVVLTVAAVCVFIFLCVASSIHSYKHPTQQNQNIESKIVYIIGETKNCPNCGAPISNSNNICEYCDTVFSIKEKNI